MNFSIATLTFDLAGHLRIKARPRTDGRAVQRRGSKVATLDQGSAFNDFGFSQTDEPIVHTWRTRSRSQAAAVRRLFENYNELRLCEGVDSFIVWPQRFVEGYPTSTATFHVKQKETA